MEAKKIRTAKHGARGGRGCFLLVTLTSHSAVVKFFFAQAKNPKHRFQYLTRWDWVTSRATFRNIVYRKMSLDPASMFI